MSFDESLKEGKLGEGLIARWLLSRGWDLLPAYEIELEHDKGPQLYTAKHGKLIAPDFLGLKDPKISWIEAKTKSAFTWHRKTQTFQTGIDRRHWLEYVVVRETTKLPLWIFFLHKPGNNAKDTPFGMISPSGLYVQSLDKLCTTIDHEHDNHGNSGMVYWQESVLRKICTYDELLEQIKQ